MKSFIIWIIFYLVNRFAKSNSFNIVEFVMIAMIFIIFLLQQYVVHILYIILRNTI